LEHSLLYLVLIYCVIREAFYLYSMQKLMNKLMSRNYQEYKFTEDRGKIEAPRMMVPPEDIPEDLGAITI
jgi:hypothetical protein